MKVFIVLAAFVGVASAGGYGLTSGPQAGGAYGGQQAGVAYGGPAVSLVPTGQSSQFRSEDNYGNFQFGYDESHATGGSSRREEGSGHVRRGSYSLSDADGRRRTVDYVADETGFHANVKTNEPGVEPRDPADVLINKNGHNVVAAPAAYAAAPIAAGPAYGSAPIAAAAPIAYGAGPVGYATPEPTYAPAPRAFSYSFGSNHISPVAYAQAPIAAAAPAYGRAY